MLAVSPLRDGIKDDKQAQMESSSNSPFSAAADAFPDFLDTIDFDDLFLGITDADVLPDLEMDFSDYSDVNAEKPPDTVSEDKASSGEENSKKEGGRKASKSCQGKRKVKVDWTPELHRRFVQAVEQLGVDKAVPSRILEIMGIDCLTRHNIASHLQKYRSHRKHLLAREAEAASWSQRRQLYKRSSEHQVAGFPPAAPPTMGFPPPPAPPMHFRPLHVWGHPSPSVVDQSHHLMHVWPPKQPWTAADPSSWHQQQRMQVPNAVSQGTPCAFPHPTPPPRSFGTAPPHSAYKPFDFLPSKESIDAAIGDVIAKPWLPLPLGLEAPCMESVMGELQRQGVPKVPPSSA